MPVSTHDCYLNITGRRFFYCMVRLDTLVFSLMLSQLRLKKSAITTVAEKQLEAEKCCVMSKAILLQRWHFGKCPISLCVRRIHYYQHVYKHRKSSLGSTGGCILLAESVFYTFCMFSPL